ncbi:hypothetical protein DFJ63DRAFT_285373 [Scheffersomyces coipomensis]|uniref:uncharacterized protein n=1 Tax=Scheffersomyces coipomensis TaxID=1788519 RepID=UPI00315C8C06
MEEDLKPFFVKWLQEEAINATKRGSKLALLYNRALDQLKRCTTPLTCPKDLLQIRYFGDKTVDNLVSRLKKHCEANKLEVPPGFAQSSKESVGKSRSNELLQARPDSITEPRTKKARVQKPYVPKHRSGGYGIMLALYIRDKERVGLNKEEIIRIATPYCDKSFTSNPSVSDFYSAWNSIKVLFKHDLVSSTGHSPKIYYLTDTGLELAKQLTITEGIQSSPIRQEAEVSFDNEVRVTPDSSFNRWTKSLQELYNSPLKELSSNIVPSSPEKPIPLPPAPVNTNTSATTEKRPSTLIHDSANRIYAGINYEVWKKDEFEVILIVDTREIRSQQERDFFYSRLTNLGIKNEVRALPLGDVLWIARHKKSNKEVVLNHICERKRLDDLASSIKDGRFQEQKNRLKKSAMKYCYYLVEESNLTSFVQPMGDAIQTAISMTITISNFCLKRFKDIDETIAFLSINTRVIKEQIDSNDTRLMILRPKTIENQVQYSEMINQFRDKFEQNGRSTNYECVHSYPIFQSAMGKTGMMTVKEMFIMMLMTIKGLSLEKAIVIQNEFPTPNSLLQYYHTSGEYLTEASRKELLMKRFENQIGNKKIGKVLSEKIYDIWGASAP